MYQHRDFLAGEKRGSSCSFFLACLGQGLGGNVITKILKNMVGGEGALSLS